MTRRPPDTCRQAAEEAPMLRAREDRSRAAQERRALVGLEQAEAESQERIRAIREARRLRRDRGDYGVALPPVPRALLGPVVCPWGWERET